MQHRANRDHRSVRSRGESAGRGFRTAIGHVERLESRAVLNAESVLIPPPPIASSSAVDAAEATRTVVVPISPVVAARLRLTMPAETRAGVPTLMTATALDAAGRPMTSFNGTATVSSSDSSASLPLIEVSFKNGRASFAVTFATAGRQSVTVTSLVNKAITATASTSVTAAPTATSFLVSMPRRMAVGTPALVTLVAVDARGRVVPTFSGTATLASSDPAAKLPPSVRFVSGRATVRVTFGTLGEQTLTVTSGPSTGGDISGTGKIQVGEVVTQRIRTLPVARP
ncbi:MAG: hypothetical protein ACKOEM_04315 [Planctomycetia bacterium]